MRSATMSRCVGRFTRWFAGRAVDFHLSTKGVAAVEFALILPLMLIMYVGMVEVTRLVNVDRKVTQLSRTLADLVGRTPDVTDAGLTEIFEASAEVMRPYDRSRALMRISSIYVKNVNGNLLGRVCWSEHNNWIARSANDVVAVPDGFRTEDSSFILAEANYVQQPIVTVSFITSVQERTLGETTPWPVRTGREVARKGKTCL